MVIAPAIVVAVAVAATAATTAISINAAQQQAKAQARAAKFNAELAANDLKAQANLAERESQVNLNAIQAEELALGRDLESRGLALRREQAGTRAAIGASGLEFVGSPLLLAVENAREAELDLENLRFTSQQRQVELRDQATLAGFQASEFRRQGRNAIRVGRFQAGQARFAGNLRSAQAGVSGLASGTGIVLRSQG